VSGSTGEWEFRYDIEGRLVSAASGSQSDVFDYDQGGRLTRLNRQPQRYDERGRLLVDHSGAVMLWGFQNNLAGVKMADGRRVLYLYDHLKRLIARKLNNDTVQYFYGDPRTPFLVTHVLRPKTGALASMAYDVHGRLLFAEASGRRAYVACVGVGSPLVFFGEKGEVLREISHHPFGSVSYDSSASGDFSLVPVGFAGGIFDREAGVLHFQGKGAGVKRGGGRERGRKKVGPGK